MLKKSLFGKSGFLKATLGCCCICLSLSLNAQTKVYSTHSSSGNSGKTTVVVVLQEGKVLNESNAVGTTAGNASLSVYSTSSLVYDGQAWIQLKFINGSEQIPANTPVYVKYESATANILNLLLSSSASVKAYKNATVSTNGTEAASSFTGVVIGGQNYLRIVATENFNAVRISLTTASLLLGAAGIDIDNAYFECPGSPVAQTPAAVCAGSSATLAVSSPVSALTYSWYAASTGGTALYTGNSVITSAISSNTTYYLGSSLLGCSGRGSTIATVNVLPNNPSISNKTICNGSSASLKVSNPDSAVAYKWFANISDTSWMKTDTAYTTATLSYTKQYYVMAEKKSTGCRSGRIMVSAVVPSVSGVFGNNGDSVTCLVKSNSYIDFVDPATGRLLASINSHGQDLGNVTTKIFKANAPINVQPCGSNALHELSTAMARHWKIEPAHQPSASVDIKLYYSQSEFSELQSSANGNLNPNDDIESPSDIILTKYHSNTSSSSLLNCDGLGVTKTFANAASGAISDIMAGFSAAGRYVQFSIPGFSEMWLHGSANMVPLPIELLSFTAKCNKSEVALKWATATEINNKGFKVQNSSDGNYWNTVAFVPGVGNSTEKQYYVFTDTKPLAGTSYYRLQQQDVDGKTTVFDAVATDCGPETLARDMKVVIYPNPVNEEFSIALQSEGRIDGVAEIVNALGHVIFSMPVHVPAGGNSVAVNASLEVGAYFVRIVNNNDNRNSVSKLYVSK